MSACAVLFALVACAQTTTPAVVFDEPTLARILQHAPLTAPPADPTNRVADDPHAARLGQALFYDARLSKNGQVSCATCHDPALAFSDGRALARGMGTSTRNAPSLYNVAWQRWLFWDGRADSTWAQALQPLESATELGGDRTAIVALIASDVDLRANYERVFGTLANSNANEIDRAFANAGKSIAAYERRLVSNDSSFDRFARALRNKDAAARARYSEAAQRGLALFVGRGNCRLCHAGPLFSDGEFHDVGIPPLKGVEPNNPSRFAGVAALARDPFRASGAFSDAPDGEHARELATLTSTSELFGQVKTPSLRNVARTAPYMHQGQFATLDEVLRFYSTREGALPPSHHGESILKPLDFSAAEVADLKAFLETLTDESLPDELRRAPSRAAAVGDK